MPLTIDPMCSLILVTFIVSGLVATSMMCLLSLRNRYTEARSDLVGRNNQRALRRMDSVRCNALRLLDPTPPQADRSCARRHRRVLRQELLHPHLRRSERCPFLPLRDVLRVGQQLRGFIGDRGWMRLVVARQHERRCPAALHEFAIHAVDETRRIEVMAARI